MPVPAVRRGVGSRILRCHADRRGVGVDAPYGLIGRHAYVVRRIQCKILQNGPQGRIVSARCAAYRRPLQYVRAGVPALFRISGTGCLPTDAGADDPGSPSKITITDRAAPRQGTCASFRPSLVREEMATRDLTRDGTSATKRKRSGHGSRRLTKGWFPEWKHRDIPSVSCGVSAQEKSAVRRSSDMMLFHVQQRFLPFDPVCEAGERAAAAHDPMARDKQDQRIAV